MCSDGLYHIVGQALAVFSVDCYFYNPILPVFKYAVCFLYFVKAETVGDKRCGVDFALFYKTQYFIAVATVNTPGLEGQVFSIHVRQRKYLGLVIHGNNCNRGIWSCAPPRHFKGIVSPGNLHHNVSSAVVTVPHDKILAFIGLCHQHFGIMLTYKNECARPTFRIQ